MCGIYVFKPCTRGLLIPHSALLSTPSYLNLSIGLSIPFFWSVWLKTCQSYSKTSPLFFCPNVTVSGLLILVINCSCLPKAMTWITELFIYVQRSENNLATWVLELKSDWATLLFVKEVLNCKLLKLRHWCQWLGLLCFYPLASRSFLISSLVFSHLSITQKCAVWSPKTVNVYSFTC